MDWEKFFEGIDFEKLKTPADITKHIKAKLKESKSKLLVDSSEEPTYIPKYRLDNEITKRKNAEQTIKDLEKDLENKEGAEETIQKFKEDNEALEKKLEGLEKSRLIENDIQKYTQQPHDVKDLIDNYLDLDKIVIKDGTASGIKEQLDVLAKEKSYLFKPIEGGSKGPGQPGDGGKNLEGKDGTLGDKLAKGAFEKHADIAKAQDSFFK